MLNKTFLFDYQILGVRKGSPYSANVKTNVGINFYEACRSFTRYVTPGGGGGVREGSKLYYEPLRKLGRGEAGLGNAVT